MLSEFRKLICKELGDQNYNRYADWIRRDESEKRNDLKRIFGDMYQKLEGQDGSEIAVRHDRLNESLLLAFRISRMYAVSWIVYLAAIAVLFLLPMTVIPTLLSVAGISFIFGLKTYEYVVNKYCYVDAQIVLVYRAVLNQLLLKQRTGKTIVQTGRE